MDTELLLQLCDVPGVPGREERVRSLTAAALKPLVDRLSVDKIGNLIGIKDGVGPRVMLSAHMDEIGFMVSHIDDRGFLRLNHVGGTRITVLEGQRVIVSGKRALPGVLFAERGWLRLIDASGDEVPTRIEQFYVDLALPTEEVVETVSIGDQVTMDQRAIELGDTYSGKAMDDRAGVFIMIEALRQQRAAVAEICAVGSVQEEVGCRGAKVAAFALQPDVAVAIDVYPVLDVPGVEEHEMTTRQGKGIAIKVVDGATIADRRLVQFLRQIAEGEGIPYQMQVVSRGGTDAATIHLARAGTPSVTLSIPTRYTHTAVETVHRSDLRAGIELVARFLERAHRAEFGEWMELK